MPFPSSNILDTCARPDGGPPPSANWLTPAVLHQASGLGMVVDGGAITSEANDYGAAVWATASAADQELLCEIAALPQDGLGVTLTLRVPVDGTLNYYACTFGVDTGAGDLVQITRWDDAGGGSQTGTILYTSNGQITLQVGDQIGFRAFGSILSAYHLPTGFTSWNRLAVVTDATHAGGGRVGIEADDNVGHYTAIRGGVVLGGAVSFPSTTVLDDFNRANEGPPPSANWGGTLCQLQVVSNTCTSELGGVDLGSWLPLASALLDEAFLTILAVPSGIGAAVYLLARIQDPDMPITQAYGLAIWPAPLPAELPFIQLFKTDGSISYLTQVEVNWLPGDTLGLSVETIGADVILTGYLKSVDDDWREITTYVDTLAGGYAYGDIGMGMTNDNLAVLVADDFGGGRVATPVDPTLPVNYQTLHFGA